MAYLGNPKLVMMAQDSMPVANYELPSNPTATVNPVRIPVTWLNTTTGNIFICTDNTTDANVWKLKSGFRGCLIYPTATNVLTTATWEKIVFGATKYDTDTFWTVGSPTRITIPAGVSKVRVIGCVTFGTSGVGARGWRLYYINTCGTVGSPLSR
jgi:hypothetical protein